MRIGKWAEAKIVYSDTSTGRRGITRSPAAQPNYVRQYQGRIPVPASSTAGTGGSVRVLKATHGLDSIVGGEAIQVGGRGATPIQVSVVNASTIRFQASGYTAATMAFHVIIWGTSSA